MLENRIIVKNAKRKPGILIRYEGYFKDKKESRMFGHVFAQEDKEKRNYILYYQSFGQIKPNIICIFEKDMIQVTKILKEYIVIKGKKKLVYDSIVKNASHLFD